MHWPTEGTVVGVGVEVGVSEEVDEILVDDDVSEEVDEMLVDEYVSEEVLDTLVEDEVTLLELVVGVAELGELELLEDEELELVMLLL